MTTQMNLKKGFSLIWDDFAMIDRLLPIIAEAGFEGVEPTFNPAKIPSPENYTKQAPELKKRCEASGLAIPNLRAGSRPWTTIPAPDPKVRRQAIEYTRIALEYLKLLGDNVLPVVPGQIRADVSFGEH